ncbi:MAG: DNA-binding protein [Gallionella sp.]
MATNLVVRNVDEEVALALKKLAAAHGRSAEAEHREILKSVLQGPKRRSAAEVLSYSSQLLAISSFLASHS